MADVDDRLDSDLEDDLLDELEEAVRDDEAAEETDDMMKFDSVREVTKVLEDEQLHEHLEKLEEAGEVPKSSASVAAGSKEYQLIMDSNQWVLRLNRDITKVHKFIKDHYAVRFPELEGYVFDPIAYAKAVQIIGNKSELTTEVKDLHALVANHTVMIIQMTLSTTPGRTLTPEELECVNAACDEMLGLEEAKQVILEFVESRMTKLAPNMSAIIGTAIAARLLGAAGGIGALAKLNSNIIRILGKSRKDTGGFSATTTVFHVGFLGLCDIMTTQLDADKRRTANLLANKLTLAIRTDATNSITDGSYGKKLREDILSKIEQWKAPSQARTIKALPAPKDAKKTKRAGAKAQRMKAKWKQTEVSQAMNRMQFGVVEDEPYLDSESFGNLKNLDKMKLEAETFVKPTKRQKLSQAKQSKDAQRSGLATSLAFTPVQGMDLGSVDFASEKDEKKSKYFGTATPFGCDTRPGGAASFFGSVAGTER
eukprot:TRINITY_DN7199_c0_g1_i1.p1 TRINITY_DN7199_c0_g1~~TRINITY_DN7199_c0_g1_i1.p1  ORF type:complete len:483 (+),score=197.60 TRINITY_DN7199_c0_g1_i1:57-1505(+)